MKHICARGIFYFLLTVVLVVADGCRKIEQKPLDILTPPSLSAVVGELGAMFEQNYGIPVNVKPVDISYVDCETFDDVLFCNDPQKSRALNENGCVADILPISYTVPVFVLLKDNSRHITSIEGLISENLNITILGPSDSLRRQAGRFFSEYEKWPEIGYDVSLTDELKKPICDAILTWKFIADAYDDEQLTIIPLSDHTDSTVNIDVLVLTHCKDIKAYQAFLKTLTSKSARDILKKHNLSPLVR